MKKRKGASTGATIGILIVGLLIGAGVTYVALPSLVSSATSTTTVTAGTVTTTVTGAGGGVCNGGTYPIGLLTDLTGDLKAQGILTQTAVAMAVDGLNNYTKSIGCNATFTGGTSSTTFDYASDPSKIPSQIQALHSAGIQVAVGPLDSASIEAILGYANTNHIVLISPSSTAFGFALPNDYLFRTVPSDFWQGQADAAELKNLGIQAIIVINRIGIYADGLANSTSVNFAAVGGHVVDHIRYDPKTTDFTSQISTLASDWTSAVATYGAHHVAIYEVSFEEIDQLFLQAKSEQPTLVSGPSGGGPAWFGNDGVSQDTVVSGNSSSGPIAAQVELPSTVFSPANNSIYPDFQAAFMAKSGGQTPTIYQTGAYDDAWLAGLAILAAGKYDGAAIQQSISPVAANYYGVLGWDKLDANGDILSFPGYSIYRVNNVGGTTSWVLAGYWEYPPGQIVWLPGQQPTV